MPKLLFITRWLPLGFGSTEYINAILNGLSSCYEVSVFELCPYGSSRNYVTEQGWRYIEPPGLAYAFWRHRVRLFYRQHKRNKGIARYPLHAAVKWIDTWIATAAARASAADVVLVNYFCLAPLTQALNRHCDLRVGVLTHDVCNENLAGYAYPAGSLLNGLTPELEAQILDKANFLIAINDRDACNLRNMVPGKDIIVTPFAQEKPSFQPIGESGQRPSVLVVGSGFQANVEGVEWLIEKVWPLVHAQCPQLQLRVAGNVCRQLAQPKGIDHICLLGYLDDLSIEYQCARMAVVPLQRGSGTKIKSIEALAWGKPLVSTSVGLQGLEFALEQGLRHYDSPVEFAEEIVHLAQDQQYRAKMSALSQELHNRQFTPDTAHRDLLDYLEANL